MHRKANKSELQKMTKTKLINLILFLQDWVEISQTGTFELYHDLLDDKYSNINNKQNGKD